MRVGAVNETGNEEGRVAITPDSAQRIGKLGHDVILERGAGLQAGFPDHEYEEAGVTLVSDDAGVVSAIDVLVRVREPDADDLARMTAGQTLISFFYPGRNETLLAEACNRELTVVAMDMVPRISRAQKMDALSSMANIAGYRAVIEASAAYGRFLSGQITAAGKNPPARVLVVGAGVAGLSAIGTAVSLGAVVRAFDVRPEVAEQIASMGAEFLYLDFDDRQTDAGGYAKPSSPEFREKQLELFHSVAPETDILITTALIPGMDAPKLWLGDMVDAMPVGAVIVDLAAEAGGNCEYTRVGERHATGNGVTILGYTDLPSRMPKMASLLYASNITQMLGELTPEKDGRIVVNMDDDVIRGSVVTHQGAVTYPPPRPKTAAIAKPPARRVSEPDPAEIEAERVRRQTRTARMQSMALLAGTLILLGLGMVAPVSFMQHLIVFILSCFVGYHVIWNVSHALHTPLMSITNAISGIIVVGAMLQIVSGTMTVVILAAISVLIATVNIVGGFTVTRRMLAMFRKS
ncbi:MAG: Re/Si-specific NAD(P)(+) transhydrogenase subunit alpha [Rhodobacteraceae bacterium]|nr:Re/Si-specific NAD(P)(+) transhydrogenase subunit alpha [Paracoccaceae bacterium]